MSNFALTPMLITSLKQLIAWGSLNIQDYCEEISNKAIVKLQNLGCYIEEREFRGAHLFGLFARKHGCRKVKSKFHCK